MSIENHLAELRRKHQVLDESIKHQQGNAPGCCSLRLQKLKKQKLQLKDEIARIERAGAEVVDFQMARPHNDSVTDTVGEDHIAAYR